MRAFVVLLVILATAFCEQAVPIPPAVDGFLVGNTNATLQVDVFLDPLCGDCLNDWPTIKKVAFDVIPYGVSFRFHLFPLPYHMYAFLFSQGASYFIRNAPLSDNVKYIELCFRLLPDYVNNPTVNRTAGEVTTTLIDIVAKEFPTYNRSQIVDAFTNVKYITAARTSWKYATHQGVSGTPWFKANGVNIDGAASFAYADWINFLKKYVPIQNASQLITENTKSIKA